MHASFAANLPLIPAPAAPGAALLTSYFVLAAALWAFVVAAQELDLPPLFRRLDTPAVVLAHP